MDRSARALTLLLLFFLVACSQKKKQLNDEDTVAVADFIDFFPDQKLPVQVADSGLLKKNNDSLRIGNKIFAQFVPDSVLRNIFGKAVKPMIYPIGKTVVKGGETYLFLRAVAGARKAAALLVFDKDSFVTALPLVVLNGTPKANDQTVANMDSRYTVTTLRQQISADGQIAYNKKVYVYNTEGLFTLILTESNAGNASTGSSLQNPLDTLKASHKWSGDYLQDKKNIVSIRDSKKTNHLMLFVHFEKDGGTCKGELKAELTITGTNTARFVENNGTCAIDFQFSGNTVRMKELEGCGSYRDIKCFFEGAYTRKKKATPTNAKKKK